MAEAAARHPLDRPIWSALSTRQQAFAVGDERALRYQPDVEPFAAARDDEEESLKSLARLLPWEGGVVLLQVGESPVPPGAVVESTAVGVQMVLRELSRGPAGAEIQRLSEADAPEMLALATLTAPGPFLGRTHLLGDFIGVREQGRLAAMAGERMKPPGWTEISGVCTHPDFRGRGYAGLLSRAAAERVLARGERPFLHAYADNHAAIGLYRSLGFEVRTEVVVTTLRRAG